MGRSRGGFSSKIHAITTTKGKPLHVILTAGQQHDSTEAENLIAYATGKALMADAGYDADRIVDAVRARGMKPVIAMNPTRKHNRRRKDRARYRLRYQVECFFHGIKRFRAIASRLPASARESARRPPKPCWRQPRQSLHESPFADAWRLTRANTCKYRPKCATPHRGTEEPQLNRQPTKVGGGDRVAPHSPH